MVGSSPNAYDYGTSYHSASKNSLCSVWFTRKSCVGQCNLYQLRKNILCQNGVEHVMCDPYHPATNGMVERALWIFKEGMKKLKKGDIHVHTKLAKFWFSYRMIPQNMTGVLLAELLMGRRPRSTLALVKPDVHKRVEREQERQKLHMISAQKLL